MILGEIPLLPQGCLALRTAVPEGAQVHAGGDDLDPAVDAVPAQQLLHFSGRRDDAGRMAADPAGEGGDHIPAHPHTGGEVVGVVLVDRVVGVDDGHAQAVREGGGHPKGAEFALTVDDIRLPGGQFPQQASGAVHLQPRSGVNAAGADRTHVINIAVLIGMYAVGQSDDAHLVAAGLQLAPQHQYGGDNAVDNWLVPVCCNQYFHFASFQ